MKNTPSALHYLQSISYWRVSYKTFHRFKVLLNNKNGQAIDDFVENKKHRKLRYDALQRNTIKQLDDYYNDKSYEFSLSFRLLELLLNSQKHYFSNASILPKQPFLFQNLSPLNSNYLPAVMLLGEADFFKFDKNYSAYNYLTPGNINRICDFFEKSQLHSKYHFLLALNELQPNDYHQINVIDYSQFISKYTSLEHKIERQEDIESHIWSLDEEEWRHFIGLKVGFDSFFKKINQLYFFFQECRKYKEEQVIIRYYFA